MKKLEIYLQALQAGQHERKIILKTIEELKSCTPQELSENLSLIHILIQPKLIEKYKQIEKQSYSQIQLVENRL